MDTPGENNSNDLFHWTSFGPKKSHKKKTDNEIKIWSKKTEAAVEDAVSVAMGKKQASNKHLLHDDNVYSEARSLLNKWISDKNTAEYTLTSEDDAIDYNCWNDLQGVPGVPQRYQIKKEWDHLMKDLEQEASHRVSPPKRNMGTTLDGINVQKNAGTSCDAVGAKSMGTMYEHPHPRRNVAIECDEFSFPHHNIGTTQHFNEGLDDLYESRWLGGAVPDGDDDESEVGENVQDIMKRLMDKEYVPKSKLREKERPVKVDLKLKMDVRQEQARQKREDKRKQEEERRKQLMAKREAEVAARKILLEEERVRITKIKQEEELIQKEMIKIRKEMNEKKLEEEHSHQKELERISQLQKIIDSDPSPHSTSRSDKTKRIPGSVPSTARSQLQEIERRKEQIGLIIATKEKENLKKTTQLMRQCFCSWYSVVLNRRMKLKEVATIYDWQLLHRYFQIWRNWYRSAKHEREIKQKEKDVKEEQRKIHMADNFRRSFLQRKCFLAWRLDCCREKEIRAAVEFETKAKSKMAAFLEAAESGRLAAPPNQSAMPSKVNQRNVVMKNIANKIKQPDLPKSSTIPCHTNNNSHAPCSESANQNQADSNTMKPTASSKLPNQPYSNCKAPTEAWQVHRGHAYLPLEQIISADELLEDDTNEPEISSARYSNSNRDQQSQQTVRRSLKPPKIVNTYENRHKAQQKILMEQQLRIKDQQRLIEDLQSNQKRQQLDLEIQTQNISQAIIENVNSKLHIKTKSAFGDLRKLDKGIEIEDLESPTETDLGLSSAVSDQSTMQKRRDQKKNAFVKKMEDRAEERARMKQDREEKKRLLEEERLQKLEEKAAELKKIEEEVRQAKLTEIREKKRQEKEREQERLSRLERLKEMVQMAVSHRNKVLLKKYGWEPWRKLMEKKRRTEIRSQEFYENKLTSIAFEAWYLHTQEVLEAEDDLVHTFYTTLLLRRCFYRLKMHKFRVEKMEDGALRWHNQRVYSKYFSAWKDHAVQMKIDRRQRECLADEFNHRRILNLCFQSWRQFPHLIAEEREKEKRKEELRRKVAALVPDYTPVL